MEGHGITVEGIRAVLPTELPDPDIAAYIPSGEALMGQVFRAGVLPPTTLAVIGCWLTAHLIASTRERLARKEGAGGASIEYVGEFGAGLASTPYGQMAMVLDTTGALQALAGRRARTVAVKGRGAGHG